MINQFTETLKSKPINRRDPEELQRLIEPVKSDFVAFDEKMESCLVGDSPMITSIARHLLKSKGKRIRPALLFLLSHASGQFTEHTVNASVAIELIHAATLLHDDVVDESEMRRNQQTVNVKWTNLISVLMGDYLFAKAFKIMSSVNSIELMKAISAATERVSVGELRQIEETRNYDISEKEYLRIIADKTASLFAVSCQVGPILSGADDDTKDRFSRFGEALGISFQIADDLLDFTGDSNVTGKEPGNDVLTGKVTLPLIHSLQTSDTEEAVFVRKLLEQGAEPEDFQRTLDFVRQTGGISYATIRAHEICDEGFDQIRYLEKSVYADSLLEIARFATHRAS